MRAWGEIEGSRAPSSPRGEILRVTSDEPLPGRPEPPVAIKADGGGFDRRSGGGAASQSQEWRAVIRAERGGMGSGRSVETTRRVAARETTPGRLDG